MLSTEQIVELAHRAPDVSALGSRLLDALASAFDAEVASLHVAAAYPVTGSAPQATLGIDTELLRIRAGRWPHYIAELEPVGLAAPAFGGVLSDRDVFGAQRARKAYHRETVAPVGDYESLIAYLCFRGQPTAAVHLGRRKSTWTRAARQSLAQLRPALALALAATSLRVPVWPRGVRLTAGEHDVLQGIEGGLTNAQIAATRGTSVNTVRNQVASLLDKLQLGSRTELAAARLGSYGPTPARQR